MQPIAGTGLRHLVEEGVRVAEQQVPDGRAPSEFLAEHAGFDPQRLSGDLNHNVAWPLVVAKQDRQARHPLIPDTPHLGGRPVLHRVDQCDGTTQEKVGKVDRLARVIEDLLEAPGSLVQDVG